MADRDRKKALFRAKLNERQQQKRIEDLLRYNEQDKPLCQLCKLVLKSESDWLPHKASRKHQEALDNLKATASRKNSVSNSKSETPTELPVRQGDTSQNINGDTTSIPSDIKKSGPSSAVPAKNQDTKRQKVAQSTRIAMKSTFGSGTKQVNAALPEGFFDNENTDLCAYNASQAQLTGVAEDVTNGSETKQAKGALPEGFFDNKDADLRARGIEPVKPDVKDEYKEFEKLIQEDLVEVDNRLEEEEIDAAEQIEEEESREQSTYRSKVEEIKRKKQELRAARATRTGNTTDVSETKSDKQVDSWSESEEEDEDDRSFTLDWRAQHL